MKARVESPKLLSSQIGALKECTDFCNNGYNTVVELMAEKWWYFKFRHRKNGNVIVLQWKRGKYWIKINGEVKKESYFWKEIKHDSKTP